MQPSAYDLHEYYLTAQGRAVRAALSRALSARFPQNEVSDTLIIGAGYAIPYLEDVSHDTATNMALLPAAMGALHWGQGKGGRTVLATRKQWPLPPASADLIIMSHELEYAENSAAVLDEAWRVLKPEGRLLLIVPNRRAPWTRAENNPFGHGRPFSRAQLYALLREREFTLEHLQGALLAPPLLSNAYNARIMPVFEHLAPYLTPLCGVYIVDARKRLFSPISGKPRPVTAAKPAPAWVAG